MKYLKLFLSILILLFTLTTTYAQPDCLDDDPDCIPNTNPNLGPGAPGIPIDDYAPILVIIGITVAGTVLYRKQQKQVN